MYAGHMYPTRTQTHSIIHTEIMLGETSLEIISHVVEEEVCYLKSPR